MARRVFAITAAVALLAPAVAFGKAIMQSPATAKLGAHVSISASGLKPGHYTLELVFTAFPGGNSPTNCVGTVGSATAQNGRVTISGVLPSRLGCYQGVGEVEGHVNTKPGKYDLTLGVRFHPNGFSAKASFVINKIRLTR